MPFEVQILGNSSAVPTLNRHPSCQYLKAGSNHYLIDCGEAAQIQMLRFGVKSSRIEKIFISHLHPDHILGLPGYLSSQSLQARKLPLDIYAPKGIQELLENQFLITKAHISFPIHFHELEDVMGNLIFEDHSISIFSYPLLHRLPCWGFVFIEKKAPRKIIKERVLGKNLEPEGYEMLRYGKNYTNTEGELFEVKHYTEPTSLFSSYGYFTDTLFLPDLAAQLPPLNLIYHEATFLNELLDKAKETYHSTALQAAEFAKIAKAEHLIIGHFSSRYKDLSPLLHEARTIFSQTELAIEGEIFYS